MTLAADLPTSRPGPAPVGEESGFEALFLAHYAALYRLLFRIVGTREEAEDLAQEAFLRLSRQRFTPDREHNVRGWLFRVASNLAFNALRSRRRAQTRSETAFGQTDGAGEADPVSAAVRDDERVAVRRTLAALPERQAQLLLLRHAGLSYREIAEALGLAPTSIGASLARAEAAFEAAWRRG